MSRRTESFYVTETYGGCLEGRPSNEEVISWKLRDLCEMWGERPTLVRRPEGDDRLPRFCYAAWVSSYEAFDPDDDGTELVVVWFSDEPPPQITVTDEQWRAHAKGWTL